MSNKTQLQTNNTALDGYIARINAAKEVAASLPDAGSGGGEDSGSTLETVEFYISNKPWGFSLNKIYGAMTQNGVYPASDIFYTTGDMTFYVVKGSVVIMTKNSSYSASVTTGATIIADYGTAVAVKILTTATDRITISFTANS